jgi:hypothetical protein
MKKFLMIAILLLSGSFLFSSENPEKIDKRNGIRRIETDRVITYKEKTRVNTNTLQIRIATFYKEDSRYSDFDQFYDEKHDNCWRWEEEKSENPYLLFKELEEKFNK